MQALGGGRGDHSVEYGGEGKSNLHVRGSREDFAEGLTPSLLSKETIGSFWI